MDDTDSRRHKKMSQKEWFDMVYLTLRYLLQTHKKLKRD